MAARNTWIIAAVLTTAVWFDLPVNAQAPTEARPLITLAEARDLLRQRNIDLEIARQAVEQAAVEQDRAWAALFPHIRLLAEYILHDEEIVQQADNPYTPLEPYLQSVYDRDPELQRRIAEDPEALDVASLVQATSEPVVVQYQHDYLAAVTVEQILFDWQAFSRFDLADVQRALALAQQEQLEYELVGVLDQLYFSALTLQRFVEVSDRKVELARITHERARTAFEHEIGRLFEVNRAEVALSRAMRERTNAMLAYDRAIEAIALLLNREADFDVQVPPERNPPSSWEEVYQEALRSRTDIHLAELEVHRGQLSIDEVRAQRWPRLTAQGSATVRREALLTGNELVWMIAIQAVWDLFDGGLRRVETNSRQLDLVRSELGLEQQRIRMESDIRRAWLDMQARQQLAESARAEAELARQNLLLVQAAWELGEATQLEVEYAQEQLYLSELALADTQTSLQAEIYGLYRLAGELP